MEEKTYPPYMDYDVKTIKTMKKDILPYFLSVYDSEENKHEIVATDGYEIKEENGKYYAVKKKPKYPSSYEECCDILQVEHTFEVNDLTLDEESLIKSFIQLKRCRDAYWKIAGEQMGLGKPWEPDWDDTEQDRYVICTDADTIYINRFYLGHNMLAFPTKEMCYAFYENFKDFIEAVKELL